MAVDARTQKDGDSPLKSVSWSETTVAQVDDRCVQAPRREFISLMSGKGLRKYQKQKLVKFDGIDTKRLLDNSESEKYIPLCDIFNAVEELAKSKFRWKVVANHGESAEVDHKPDLARYPVDVPAAVLAYTRDMTKDDPNIARCAWAWMNSYVEVKNAEVKSPFFFAHNIDKDGRQKFLRHSDIGRKARGQFIKYATEAMLRQHRTHYYSFYLSEMSARVFRWDRVGCIASEPIDLRENPEDFLDILYRLATSPDHGGVDNTVRLASTGEIATLRNYDPGDNLALQEYHESMLDDQLSYPIYKVSCPAISFDGSEASVSEKTYLIGRYAFGHYSPVGRCTKGYPALDMQTNRLTWFKDQWRCVVRPHTELDAYIRLHEHKVTHIATPAAGGDVGHRTITQEYLTHLADDWRPAERVHTRLVTKEVGRLLETYKDSWELLNVCAEAFYAHTQAWELAHILHRDISIGNIMIDAETGKGFLNDWDLCKYREDMEAKRPASEPSGISGTWAFKSSLALRYPRKPPELADDLESFIYVITFLAYRFHHHELSSEPLDDTEDAQITANASNQELMGFVSTFFYAQKRVGNGFFTGGRLKYQTIFSGAPPAAFKPIKNGKRSLVETFLLKAYRLLQEHYWSLDESELAEYAAHEGDCAAPDEVDDVTASDSPPRRTEALAEHPGQGSIFSNFRALFGPRAATSSEGKEVLWKTVVQEKTVCPFDNPQPVLKSHTDLGLLFLSIAQDEHGRDLDLQSYRDDKRFDQFLSWRMIGYLNRKGKTGQWKGIPSWSSESAAKRKREEEDNGEDVTLTPPKRPTVLRTEGPRTRALAKAAEQVVVSQEAVAMRTANRKRRAAAAAATAGRSAKTALPKKPIGAQSKKYTAKASTSRTSPKISKPQPTKIVTKAPASRGAQAARKSLGPRRSAVAKVETTGPRSKTTKAKVAAPPAPTRRSKRLAKIN